MNTNGLRPATLGSFRFARAKPERLLRLRQEPTGKLVDEEKDKRRPPAPKTKSTPRPPPPPR